MSAKVLCVDDDANILAGFQRSLRRQFSLDLALGGEEALAAIEAGGPYAVVVADMQMPGMNGIQFLVRVGEKWPDTVRIMLTGNADQQTAVEAVNKGQVYRFLTKPCSAEMLALALEAGIKQFQLLTAERELLENTVRGSIRMLTDILSAIDARAFGRAQRLRDHMREFLKSLGIQENWQFEVAALLSSIGYVTIPATVLQRRREGRVLTGPELAMVQRVPAAGSELLSRIPRLEEVARIILYQDKNFDGSGFPADGTAGEAIPVASRILKVLSDLQDLLERQTPRDQALRILQQRKGRYDPRVLDAAFRCFDAYLPELSPPATHRRPVRVSDLKPGLVLLSDVETKDGLLILPAGNQLTPVMLEKIRNFAKLCGIGEPIWVQV